jgi:hypothetical protein
MEVPALKVAFLMRTSPLSTHVHPLLAFHDRLELITFARAWCPVRLFARLKKSTVSSCLVEGGRGRYCLSRSDL